MLFNSLDYFIFLPLITILYFILNYRFRWIVLLLGSYFFYMYWKPEYILLIILSTIIDYWCGLSMSGIGEKSKRKPFLYISLISNLSLLFFFKYFNFFSGEINRLGGGLPYLNLLLPVGISFYTFQTLSYSIDIYNGKLKAERNPGIFALYVAFFPQLVAGPIERAQNLLSQFRTNYSFDINRIKDGSKRILWGLFKKVVIADRLAFLVNEVYNNTGEYSGIHFLIATIFFSFQIYCDFSGYSDIAIGSARILGINLMENFRYPYFSSNIANFWKRWHISLSTWFQDYVYIPLGGNRVLKWRWYYNLFITFLISGLWHGANWTFIIWGAIHGLYLVSYHLISGIKRPVFELATAKSSSIIPISRKATSILLTYLMVLFGWIFFRSNSISDSWFIIQSFSDLSLDISKNIRGQILYLGQPLWRFGASFGLVTLLIFSEYFISKTSIERFLKGHILIRWSFFYFLIIGILVFGVFETNEFIYFQF